jgi:hypothetical protein
MAPKTRKQKAARLKRKGLSKYLAAKIAGKPKRRR